METRSRSSNMADVLGNSVVCHPSATCHIAWWKNSIRHIENRFRRILFILCFLTVVWALASGGFRIVSDTLVKSAPQSGGCMRWRCSSVCLFVCLSRHLRRVSLETPNLQSEKNGWLKKNRLIFGLAELSRKLKKSADYKNFAAKIRLITNNFGWAADPSVITRSFEITRIIHFK